MGLRLRDLRGSRLRCLLLTSLSRQQVACVLTQLVWPFASVSQEDLWLPDGFLRPDEAKLGETPGFLSPEQREKVTEWWLKIRHHANTPNWDLVSTCTVENQPGLILIEAKGHDKELRRDGKRKTKQTNEDNHEHIGAAIQQANDALNLVWPGWSLSRDSHYQLTNRFAWAWTLADLGKPVVLVFLGALNAAEMEDRGRAFPNHRQWYAQMLAHSEGVIPREAWERPLSIHGTRMVPLVRSVDFSVTTSS